ncbi:MAG: DUF2889 domain-containing protein [Burkholderiaceae bacterium]|nr:DUF2889 domain-containing protein [Burkholderiaceae bacterium]
MPLPPATPGRKLKHSRVFNVEFFHREDGLWEIDARLTDTKTHDVALTCGVLHAHQPIHDLLLRLTVGDDANIVDAVAVMDSVPFAGYCDTISPTYKKLIGLNVMFGFRQGIKERFSGVDGCTHLNELAMILPDAAVQVFAFEKRKDPSLKDREKKPFELDNCHALRSEGPAVALYYPRWAVKPEK